MRLGEWGTSSVREHNKKTRARIRLAILAPISDVSPRTSFPACRQDKKRMAYEVRIGTCKRLRT